MVINSGIFPTKVRYFNWRQSHFCIRWYKMMTNIHHYFSQVVPILPWRTVWTSTTRLPVLGYFSLVINRRIHWLPVVGVTNQTLRRVKPFCVTKQRSMCTSLYRLFLQRRLLDEKRHTIIHHHASQVSCCIYFAVHDPCLFRATNSAKKCVSECQNFENRRGVEVIAWPRVLWCVTKRWNGTTIQVISE